MHVYAAEFGAAVQTRYRLAWVEQSVWIEGGFDGVELFELGAFELHTHLVDFLHAHAVFAGDGAADRDAQFQNARAEFLGVFFWSQSKNSPLFAQSFYPDSK